MTKAIAVVSDPIQLLCSVFHICFFYAEMPRGWCMMMGHWMCVPLVKRSGNAPTSNGWLAFACLYHLSSSDIVANEKEIQKQKTKMLICIHLFVGNSYIACYFWTEMLLDGRKHSVVDFKGFFKLPCQLKTYIGDKLSSRGNIRLWEIQKHPTWLYLARPNMRQKCIFGIFWHVFERAKYGQVGCPWKDLAKCSSDALVLGQ